MKALASRLLSATLACAALVLPAMASATPGGAGEGGGGEGGASTRARAMTPPNEDDARCGCEFDPFGALAVAGLVPTLRAMRKRRTPRASVVRAAAMLSLLAALGACSSEAPTTGARAPSSSGPTARDAVARAAVVIDVRTKEEFDSGHLGRALNLPVDDLEASIPEVREAVGGDLSRPIAVYCGSGKRAERAKAILEKAGFVDVTNAGGYSSLAED